MADHGQRILNIRQTEVGELEGAICLFLLRRPNACLQIKIRFSS